MTNPKEKNHHRSYQQPVFNDKLQQSLKQLFVSSVRRQNPVSNHVRNAQTTLPHIDFIGEEGVDHINLAYRARTELGKLLCMESPLVVEVPGLGNFASIAGLWYFLANPHDPKYIELPGVAVYSYGKKCNRQPKLEQRSRLVIGYVLWNLVLKYQDIRRALQELPSNVRFDCYDVRIEGDHSVKSRLNYSNWYVAVMESIREAVVKGYAFPDFSRISYLASPFTDVHNEEVYKNLMESFFKRSIYGAIEQSKRDAEENEKQRQAEEQAKQEKARQDAEAYDAKKLTEDAPRSNGAPDDSEEDLTLAPPPASPLIPTEADQTLLNQEEPVATPQPVNEQSPQPINLEPQPIGGTVDLMEIKAQEQ